MPDEYRNRETHAITLVSGRSLAPADPGELTYDDDGNIDPHDQAILDAGSLILVDETVDYDSQTVEALTNLADSRGLEPKGTGKDGAVLKSDLIKAHQNADKEASR